MSGVERDLCFFNEVRVEIEGGLELFRGVCVHEAFRTLRSPSRSRHAQEKAGSYLAPRPADGSVDINPRRAMLDKLLQRRFRSSADERQSEPTNHATHGS